MPIRTADIFKRHPALTASLMRSSLVMAPLFAFTLGLQWWKFLQPLVMDKA